MPARPFRTAVLAVTAAVLATGAVACGGSADGAGPAAPSSSDGAWPVSIENQFGTTEVPAEPERVVTVGFNDQDFVLALGVTPVGVRANLGDYDANDRPWAAEQLAGADLPTVGGTEIDVEAVAALEPDLIVGVYSFMDQAVYEQLSGIAPTLAQTDQYAEGATPWQEQTRLTGRALGRDDEAEALVADVEGRFADAVEQNPGFAGQSLAVDFGGVGESAHYLFGTDDLRTQFFTDLGFDVPDASTPVSEEQLPLLDQDVLIGGGYTKDAAVTDPLFAGLDVVTQDRTVYLGAYSSDLMGALGYGSPLSLPFLLEAVVPALASAADADPATAVEQPTA